MSARAGLPPRLLAVLLPVCIAGLVTLAWSAVWFAREPHSGNDLVGLLLLLAASMFAERFPVPVEGADAGGVSLLYVFVVSTTVLYGWEAGALLAAVGTFTQLLAISLYQRSTYRALHAMRLALTDPLTGLGNHRHFHERLQRELVAAEEAG